MKIVGIPHPAARSCTNIHCLQVSDFLAYTSELWERFKASGPGVPTIELAQGLELLQQFQVSLCAALCSKPKRNFSYPAHGSLSEKACCLVRPAGCFVSSSTYCHLLTIKIDAVAQWATVIDVGPGSLHAHRR